MNIGILGPLMISAGGRTEYVRLAPKPRTVLALLSGHAGGLISAASLEREVWGESPPASSSRNLHTYVLQCRKVLAQASGMTQRAVANELLVTRPGGYTVCDDLITFDYRRFAALSEKGRRALREGELMQSIDMLSNALSAWRGPAFADVVAGCVLEARRRQLQDSRLGVIEDLSDARITAGQYHEAIAGLAVPVSEHPLHEGLHFQYMRALGISGGRSRALEVFSRLRLSLVTELGIEPGAAVQQLQRRILSSADLGSSRVS